MANTNPDDRSDNAQKIQKNIGDTKRNSWMAEEIIRNTSDSKTKKTLDAKNARREKAVEELKNELEDETAYLNGDINRFDM